MGNKVIVKAARLAGAQAFFGYPITPTTEVAELWSQIAGSEEGKKDGLIFLQTEDETSAGFALIGAVLAGKKAFTASAGPGNILLQDAFAMAEALRLPTVAFIGSRGGPSTATVIYSQQELNLTCFGGNGNGMRIVYSTSCLQDLFDYTLKAFDIAWRYRFPTFVLYDGYQAKMMGPVEIYEPKIKFSKAESYFPESLKSPFLKLLPQIMSRPVFETQNFENAPYTNFRNCFSLEEEAFENNETIRRAFEKMSPKIVESEIINPKAKKAMIIAHGIVSSAAKEVTREFKDVKLFRPITLRPFPQAELRQAAAGVKKIYVFESAIGQLSRLVKEALYGIKIPVECYNRPSLGITSEEIKRILEL